MAEIHSSLGRSNIQQPQAGARHFTVSDESQAPQHRRSLQQPVEFSATESVLPPGYEMPSQANRPQDPQQFGSYEEAMAYRKQYMHNMQAKHNPVHDKTSLEVLLGIGRKTIIVPVESDIGVTSYTLCTLKSKEKKEVLKALDLVIRTKTHESVQNLRDMTLANAISEIEGRPLDVLLGCEGYHYKEKLQVRYEFVTEMEENISLLLYNKFEEMDREVRDRYSINTTEDLKGVAEAVSKSSTR